MNAFRVWFITFDSVRWSTAARHLALTFNASASADITHGSDQGHPLIQIMPAPACVQKSCGIALRLTDENLAETFCQALQAAHFPMEQVHLTPLWEKAGHWYPTNPEKT